MIRFLVTLAVAALAVGSDARLSSSQTKKTRNRQLENQYYSNNQYGYNYNNGQNWQYGNNRDQQDQNYQNYYNQNQNQQQAQNQNNNNNGQNQQQAQNGNYNRNYNNNGQQGYYDDQGNWQNYEGGSQDQAQEGGSGSQDNYYKYANQGDGYYDYDNSNFDVQNDSTYGDEDGFHYETLTKENYKKLLNVHDKMEAYRLATILLSVVIVISWIYIAILHCLMRRAEEEQKTPSLPAAPSFDPVTPYRKGSLKQQTMA